MTDEELAQPYLEGRVTHVRGGGRAYGYLREKSPEETRARQAVARLLRRPPAKVPRSLLEMLASLIDPHAGTFQNRQIKIVSRKKQVNHGRDLEIARYIVQEQADGVNTESVVTAAAKIYGVSQPTVYRALEKHRRRFERAWIIK
jgi:hypothetical protein